MTKNMGLTDRIIRVGLAIVITVLYFTDTITDTLAIVILFVVTATFIVTSFFSFCPLHFPFGITTHKKSKYLNPPNQDN